MDLNNSKKLFAESKNFIPGGVNSPVRAFNAVGGTPAFIKKASGPYIYDEDNNKYLDFVGSWGPAILGHAHPEVISSAKQAIEFGLGYGAPCDLELQLASYVVQLIDSIDMIRMVNSGTEACMSAIRLARGYTNRNKIIKFNGCYHGHADMLLVKAGSGSLTFNQPSSKGVPNNVVADTICLNFNDTKALEQTFAEHKDSIAAVIVEPIAGNMGCIPANFDFINSIRNLCDTYNSVFIMDEVMTGFRVAKKCAQDLYSVKPDLTVFGKIIGGGLPVGAFGGKLEIMQHLAPLGGVYQAGTLSGNHVAMAAGLKTLTLINEYDNFYPKLAENTKLIADMVEASAHKHGAHVKVNYVCGMFSIFFASHDINNLEDVQRTNIKLYSDFFHFMLSNGVYLAPSAYESLFLSIAHDIHNIDYFVSLCDKFFKINS